ncbi:MAG TPA: SRPBCC family protein [Caulobacteraceae bacterium]|jgi:uncharacterized protein YndB with AHSA1/START domain
MTIAPVVRAVTVKASPARAFALFTANIERWWPQTHHIGANPFTSVILEPHVGGRWFERDAGGVECLWGKVLAWDPPARLLLAWQINGKWEYDPAFLTELELSFAPAEGGATRVTLEHRDLERFGADAPRIAALLEGGWPTIMADFVGYADSTQKETVR